MNNFINNLNVNRSLLDKSGLPDSVNEVLAHFFASYNEGDCLEVIKNKTGELYSYNDSTIKIFSEYLEMFNVIEICNPYSEKEFVFIYVNNFMEILNDIYNEACVKEVSFINVSSEKRSDYYESRDNW